MVDDGGMADEGMTIDELAAASGVPSRTIRFYQSKGTLPAPERRGRVAYYRREHLDRLRTIAELQDRGLRLDAIKDVLHQVEQGGSSLQRWLGLGDELQAPWLDDQPEVVSEADLLARLGPLGEQPGVLAALQRHGLVERQGNARPARYLLASPRMVELAVEVSRAGIDLETAAEARELIANRLARVADELVTLFSERSGWAFGGPSQPEPEEIVAGFTALRGVALTAVQLLFAREMERSLRDFVERGRFITRR
jgi:DNA-binding transcriptional MerR regulator